MELVEIQDPDILIGYPESRTRAALKTVLFKGDETKRHHQAILFRSEVEAVRLASTVAVFAAWIDGEKGFMCLEYVMGLNLDQEIEKTKLSGPRNEDDVLRLIVDVLLQIAQADRVGVAHRDIHTGNIINSKSAGFFRLIDWGQDCRLDAHGPPGVISCLAADHRKATGAPIDQDPDNRWRLPNMVYPEEILRRYLHESNRQKPLTVEEERRAFAKKIQRNDLYSLGKVAYEYYTGTARRAGRLWWLRNHPIARSDDPHKKFLVDLIDTLLDDAKTPLLSASEVLQHISLSDRGRNMVELQANTLLTLRSSYCDTLS